MSDLNLTTAKSLRDYIAIEGANHPAIHQAFRHKRPNGDAISPAGVWIDNVLAPPVFAANASTDLLTTVGHGLVADTPILLETTGALPAGLTAGPLYVIPSGLTADVFKVSATLGGAAIDITGTGAGIHSWSRYLTADEQYQVALWQQNHRDGDVNLPAAILWIHAQMAYVANPQHQDWLIDDHLTRHWQWIYRSTDHAYAAQSVTPVSGGGGGGGGGPASPVPQALL